MDKNSVTQAKKQATVFRIFGNSRRILILQLLVENEFSVGEIAERIEASLQNTSQHLRLMKDKGIVISRREGQVVYYGIADNELGDWCKRMFQLHSFEHMNTY